MAATLPTKELNNIFINSVLDKIVRHSKVESRPLEIDLMPPLPTRIRLYIFNITSPPGGRTVGEHKIQLIMPGQKRGEKTNFDTTDDRIVILAGYDPKLDVFAFWDAGLYVDFPFSRNVQVSAETIYNAFAGNIGTQNRNLRGRKKEVVITAPSERLHEAMELRINKTLERLLGEDL